MDMEGTSRLKIFTGTAHPALAKEISDRIIFMDKGVIIEDASPDEVFSSDNERTREFLGKYHDVN